MPSYQLASTGRQITAADAEHAWQTRRANRTRKGHTMAKEPKSGPVGQPRRNSHPDGWNNPTRRDDEPQKYDPNMDRHALGGNFEDLPGGQK